jgi:hypothetical protein
MTTTLDAGREPSALEGETRTYPANFGEQRAGVVAVVLPMGSPDAIERLTRDVLAFGYGMGEAVPESSAQLDWMEKAEAARTEIRQHVAALTDALRAARQEREALAKDSARWGWVKTILRLHHEHADHEAGLPSYSYVSLNEEHDSISRRVRSLDAFADAAIDAARSASSEAGR